MAENHVELHVILVNLGTPSAPREQEVRSFLLEFLSDPLVVDYPRWFWQPILRGLVLRSRPRRVAELYRSIWSPAGSPQAVETVRMADALRDAVPSSVQVAHAYRYGSPSIGERLEEAARRDLGRVVVVPLFPQRTSSTTGTIELETATASERLGISSRVRVAMPDAADRGYIGALAARLRDAIHDSEEGEPPEHVLGHRSAFSWRSKYVRAPLASRRLQCLTLALDSNMLISVITGCNSFTKKRFCAKLRRRSGDKGGALADCGPGC